MHANTQIPKVIGYKRIADLAQDQNWDHAARFFWNTVVNHRSVCIGGNSVREHFHPADNFTSMLNDVQGPETCNTYNMLRLTKMLYQTSPTFVLPIITNVLYIIISLPHNSLQRVDLFTSPLCVRDTTAFIRSRKHPCGVASVPDWRITPNTESLFTPMQRIRCM